MLRQRFRQSKFIHWSFIFLISALALNLYTFQRLMKSYEVNASVLSIQESVTTKAQSTDLKSGRLSIEYDQDSLNLITSKLTSSALWSSDRQEMKTVLILTTNLEHLEQSKLKLVQLRLPYQIQ